MKAKSINDDETEPQPLKTLPYIKSCVSQYCLLMCLFSRYLEIKISSWNLVHYICKSNEEQWITFKKLKILRCVLVILSNWQNYLCILKYFITFQSKWPKPCLKINIG